MGNICPKCNTDNPSDSKFCKECASPLKSPEGISVTKTILSPPIASGKTFAGRYKIIKEIGRGGMGVVYKATDTKLKRNVALKFLPVEMMQDKKAKARFLQEAQAAAALNHPNICSIYEVDETDGQTFIAMEYIEGQTLKERIDRGPLEIDEAVRTARQVAEGLAEAHSKGIVHRDIKPANIMLTDKGSAKIMDFGIAKLGSGLDLTKKATLIGTVAYMSPEQARGDEVDNRTDIWSLGCLMYEMTAGKHPFRAEHEQATIHSILFKEPKSFRSFKPDIPENIENAIFKALEKDVSQRYKNMKEFIQILELPSHLTPAKPDKSIAVLPFANMSADPEQDYFCEGISEEIINALTHVNALRVVARTSTFSFRGKDIDIREIGRKLNVNKVLEGSVRKSGNRLRITAQLINVADGYHLWSERFDRDMEDIFIIQDEISLAIADKLKLELFGDEKLKLTKRYTENAEAYNLYLQGNYFCQMYSREGFTNAIECFEQALQKDPDYALAHVGLGACRNT
jgi:serine/threonine protein kinase